jgi:hypothetical protein
MTETPRFSLTTLQLAEQIAEAVLNAADMAGQQRFQIQPCAQAVLKVLFNTDHWFCRLRHVPGQGAVSETNDGQYVEQSHLMEKP